MKKNMQYLAIAIVGLLLIGWFGGFLTQFGFPPPTFSTTPVNQNPITDLDKQNYANGIGRWNVYESVADSLDPAVIRTSATNYKLYWYTRQGSTWIYKETAGGSTKFVSLDPADGGYVWVVIAIPAAQAFYVDYKKTISTNQYIESYLYTDVDGDGAKEFAFKYNMKSHAIPNSGYPSITFLGFLYTYDTSTPLTMVHWNSTVSGNATDISTATVSKTYDNYFTISTEKYAVALWKVEVLINNTDETKVRLKKLNVPGLGYLDVNMFDKQYTSSDYRYTYTIANSFDGADYVVLPANGHNRYDLTMQVEYTLATSDEVGIVTTVYYLIAQTEAGATITDTFYAKEAAGA